MSYKEFNIESVTQQDFLAAEQAVVAGLQEARPELDLRTGTALRDLLVNTMSMLYAVDALRWDAVRSTWSLRLLAESPLSADYSIVDELLANLLITRSAGTRAVGVVAVVAAGDRTYSVPTGYQLSKGSELYATTQLWNVTATPTDPTTQLRLYSSTDGTYFFLLPVRATADGLSTVTRGTAMTYVSPAISGFGRATAYVDFSQGQPAETLTQVLARLPETVSYRGLDSATAIAAKLRDAFAQIKAVSVIGFGQEAMLRDKHNVLGFSQGGIVDVYVRTSVDPVPTVLTKVGTKIANGVYSFIVAADEAPGAYLVRMVTRMADGIPLGSYPMVVTREAYGTGGTYHEFDASVPAETAFTIWQRLMVTVSSVEPTIVDGAPTYPDTMEFRVELYAPPDLASVQGLIDQTSQRSQGADLVARGMIPCFVAVNGTVYAPAEASIDEDAVVSAVVSYINGLRPGQVLTVSQIASVLHQFGINSVDMSDTGTIGLSLVGTVPGGNNQTYTLSGNTLDILGLDQPQALLTQSTVMYQCDRRDVFITVRQQ